jgi:hypothetical protein
MNGSHGEKTPFSTTKDIKREFKGASEVIKNGKELTAWQKVYQQKTCDPISPQLPAGSPRLLWELPSRRA